MQRPKLIASDVDGTLLDPMGRVTPRTAAVIGRAVAAGIPFVLVSGRPARWIPDVAQAAGVAGFAVCANGAVLYDIAADRVLSAQAMSPTLVGDLVHALTAAMPGASIATEWISDAESGLAASKFSIGPGYEHPWPGELHTDAAPLAQVIGRAAVKLLVREPMVSSAELAAAAAELVGDVVHITYSSSLGLLEISAKGVTKGTGLAQVASRLGVAAADVVAFGDMPNDIPMLRWAGHGVAMANAHAETLAAADEVTAANGADGLAQVLERWF